MWQFWVLLVIVLAVIWYFISHREGMWPYMKYTNDPNNVDMMSPYLHYTQVDPMYMTPVYLNEIINRSANNGVVELKSPPDQSYPHPDNIGTIVGAYKGKKFMWSPLGKKWIPQPSIDVQYDWIVRSYN